MIIPCNLFIQDPDNQEDNISFTAYFESKYVQNISVGDIIAGYGYEYIVSNESQLPLRYGGRLVVERVGHSQHISSSLTYDYVVYVSVPDSEELTGAKAFIKKAGSYQNSDRLFYIQLDVFNNQFANQAKPGYKIIDENGNEFVLKKFLSERLRFIEPVLVESVVYDKRSPVKGHASIYLSTNHLDLSMPVLRSSESDNTIRRRNMQKIDELFIIAQSSAMYIELKNGSGITLERLKPVCVDAGMYKLINVNDSNLSLTALAVLMEEVSVDGIGRAITFGRIEDIGNTWALDTVLYVNKNGSLSHTVPDIGIDGFIAQDYIIRVGMVIPNQNDINKFDLQVDIKIIARL